MGNRAGEDSASRGGLRASNVSETGRSRLQGMFLASLLLTGCTANHQGSVRLADPSSHSPVTMGIDTRDLMMAAEAAVQSILDSHVFERGPHHPAVLEIGKLVNGTSQQLDTSLLTGQIRASLLKTGTVAVADMEPEAVDSSSHIKALSHPDFTLSGRVVESRSRTGSITQSTYVFQFSLTDNNGLHVWEENKIITKQGKHAGSRF